MNCYDEDYDLVKLNSINFDNILEYVNLTKLSMSRFGQRVSCINKIRRCLYTLMREEI